jgi:hypothetical protein
VSAASLRNRGYPVWEASACGSSRSLEGDPSGSAWSRAHKGAPDRISAKPRCGGGQPKRAGQPDATGVIRKPSGKGEPAQSCAGHEPWQRGEPVRLSHRPVGHPAIAASLQPPGVGTTRQLVRGEPRDPRSTRRSAASTRAAKVGSTRCPSAWWAGEQPDGRGANPQVTAQGGEPFRRRSTQAKRATRAEPCLGRSTHLKEATRGEPEAFRSTQARGATCAEPRVGRSTQVHVATPPKPSLQRSTRAVVAPLSQPVFPRPTRPEGAWEEPDSTRSTQTKEATRAEPRRRRSTQPRSATRAEPSVTRETLVRRAVWVEPSASRSTHSSPATPHQPSALGEPIRSVLGAPCAEPFLDRSTRCCRVTRAEPELARSTQSLWRQHAEPPPARATHYRGALVQEPHVTRSTHRHEVPAQEPCRKGRPVLLGTAQALPAQGYPRGRAMRLKDNPREESTQGQSQKRPGQPSFGQPPPASYGRSTHVIGSHGGRHG